MEDHEEILDSGEIYKQPEPERLSFPELELEPDKFAEIEWTPVTPGGSSFKSHKLVETDEQILQLIGSRMAYAMGLTFILPAVFVVMIAVYMGSIGLGLMIGLVFALFAVLMIDKYTIPNIFDKRVGLYWKGRLSIRDRLFTGKKIVSINLKDIKAIQVLKEEVQTEEAPYTCYEINLVLINNERHNVVQYGDEFPTISDAKRIADFLDIPVLNNFEKNVING